MMMNRVYSRSLAAAASASRTAARTAPALRTQPRFFSSANSGYGHSAAPDAAEKASAESGGSRSKEAVETGSSPTAGFLPDQLAEEGAKGRTGGGKPLESSHHPPAQPKISNASVPGNKPNLSKEQQAEVDQHNKEFEEKHGKAAPAGEDKVNKSFWSGTGSRQINNENKKE